MLPCDSRGDETPNLEPFSRVRRSPISVHSGVRQGDNLTPTLFAMYINDFVITINELHKGISIGDRDVSCLLYADDIVLLAETPVDLQVQLDAVNNWCRKWRLKINVTKTKIMHFRKHSANQSDYQFHIGRILVTVTHIVILVWSSMIRWIIHIVLTYCQTQAAGLLEH